MKNLRTKILAVILILVLISSAYSVTVKAIGDSKEVNVIDSVVITELYDTDEVLAEWNALDPDITVHRDFKSAEAVKLFINWSDNGGLIDLQKGDYFTFVIPDIFDYRRVTNVNNKEITDSNGEVAATYSIYTNAQGRKEIKAVFTEFADTHTDISGDLWLILYIGEYESTEIKGLEFIINGEAAAKGDVTISPEEVPSLVPPVSLKYGYGSPKDVINGYYIFEWNIFLNTEENSSDTGFNVLENYYFEDIIPPDSPHVFITDALAGELNIPSRYRTTTIKEYTGSDHEPPAERYQTFLKRYYYVGGDPWVNYLSNHTLADGVTSIGIDGGRGLNISDVKNTDKIISAKLGTLTRPTLIRYYTMATIKISEGSLGDPETVKFFKNTFIGNNGETLAANLSEYYFTSGGSAKAIQGDYSFTFTKIGESNAALPGAWFSLYANEDFAGGADRVAVSDDSGTVTFNNLAEGIYYLRETTAPQGYVQNDSIYKVAVGGQGYAIYYGDHFENTLNDQGNRVVNREEPGNNGPAPVHVTLAGTKTLSGKTLENGMFVFAVKDANGNTVSIGTNDADGKIIFNTLEYTTEGKHLYTVGEVRGNKPGISYSNTLYTVAVTISQNSDGTLKAAVEYPAGGILFRNTYTKNNESGTETPGTQIPEAEIPMGDMPAKELPKTGNDINTRIWPVMLAAAISIVSVVLSADFKIQKNKRPNNKF